MFTFPALAVFALVLNFVVIALVYAVNEKFIYVYRVDSFFCFRFFCFNGINLGAYGTRTLDVWFKIGKKTILSVKNGERDLRIGCLNSEVIFYKKYPAPAGWDLRTWVKFVWYQNGVLREYMKLNHKFEYRI